jgi:hypothetical protein
LEKAKLDLPVLSGDASASTEIPRLLDGKYSPLKHLTIVNFAQGRKEFYQRLNKQSPGLTDEAQAGHGYDAMVALLRAYAATAGPKTRTEIAQQIPKQRFDGELCLWICEPVRVWFTAPEDCTAIHCHHTWQHHSAAAAARGLHNSVALLRPGPAVHRESCMDVLVC